MKGVQGWGGRGRFKRVCFFTTGPPGGFFFKVLWWVGG